MKRSYTSPERGELLATRLLTGEIDARNKRVVINRRQCPRRGNHSRGGFLTYKRK